MIAPLERLLIRFTVLEQLAGEADGGGRFGGGVDAAEWVRGTRKQSSGLFSPRTPEHACEGRGGRPGFDSGGVGGEDWAGGVADNRRSPSSGKLQ